MPDAGKMGFKPTSQPSRKAIRSEQGDKIGYLTFKNGKQHLTDVDGRVIATNIRFKKDYVQSRSGAVSGTFIDGAYR